MTFDGPRRPRRPGDELASLLGEDWQLVLATQLNVLLVGAREATRALLNTVDAAVEVDAREPLVLPEVGFDEPVILNDISTLNETDQRRLMDWLNGDTTRQIICTSTVPILPLIEAGSFAEALYYRLNALYMDLRALQSQIRVAPA